MFCDSLNVGTTTDKRSRDEIMSFTGVRMSARLKLGYTLAQLLS
jgi:hypothetical protein